MSMTAEEGARIDAERIQELPPELQQQVRLFIEFLAQKRVRRAIEAQLTSVPREALHELRGRYAHPDDQDRVVEKGTAMQHYRFNRITLDPQKCFGKPCIRGLRMPVASILSYLSSGMSVDEILSEWPELEREDIYQALGYAAWAMEERVITLAEVATQ
jgi:uncharacterized protein (DUF433 family)